MFKKYPKIYRVGHPETAGIFSACKIVVEEKMDGANVRWMWDEGREKLRYGSRRRELTDVEIDDIWEPFIRWCRDLEKRIKSGEVKIIPGAVYYAEYMIPHTIQYDWEETPMLLGFDIWSPAKDRFIDYRRAREFFLEMDVEFVPVVDEKDVDEIDDDYLDSIIPESKYYNGMAEGVVFKNYEIQKMAKLVAEKFAEVRNVIFGKSKKYCADDAEFILEKYVPPRRVEKIIMEMRNEGWEIKTEMMKELPKRVWEDVVEEEGTNILKENRVIDLRRLRRLTAKRCINVLQRVMATEALRERLNGV